MSRSHNHAAVQPTDQAWVAAQNRQTHAWLHSPAYLPIRQQMAQRLQQLLTALPQAKTSTPMSTSPDGEWYATVTNQVGSDLQSWQLWQRTSGAAQPRESVTDIYPTTIAFLPDSSGFYYDRYLAYPGHHALYFHRVGTPQRQDHCVFYPPAQPPWYYQA
ncbi:MAG: hypothetical protein KDE31_38215, partial [Caldilineaceae bacterium]|nr:hypothetical protein [Caldilineaceae bacterium]